MNRFLPKDAAGNVRRDCRRGPKTGELKAGRPENRRDSGLKA
jgi:hypothetical protein